MAKMVRGQRDLIDFAEVQHQDTEIELRGQLAVLERKARIDAEYIRQLRATLTVWTEIVGQIPDKQRTSQLSQLFRHSIELCGIPDVTKDGAA